MAIYTKLDFAEIENLLRPLQLGRLIAAHGVAAGVENTTYFLQFESADSKSEVSEFVFTIAESLNFSDIQFIAQLTSDLNGAGLPVPSPVNAHFPLSIDGKPALVIPKIAGDHPTSVTPSLCRAMGELLAKVHLVTTASTDVHESHRSLSWVLRTGNTLLPLLNSDQKELLHTQLSELSKFVSANKNMPQAIVHGDLFRDNVLVKGNKIVALIDFFSAGTGYLLFDLAIVVNDWCIDTDCALDTINYRALVEGYQAIRTPQSDEIAHWNYFLRLAALRFWVSRLSEQFLPGSHMPPGRGKDPLPYQSLILHHAKSSLAWVS